jgi:Family of unknown function (DUF6174)
MPIHVRLAPVHRHLRAAAALRLAAILVLGGMVGACGLLAPNARDLERKRLADQQSVWAAGHVDDYTFTISRQCFCPFTDPIEITVVDGLATQLTSNGEPVAAPDAQGFPKTIDELFVIIGAQLAKDAIVEVEWDDAFGFPTSIAVDPIINAVDDEFGYLVTDFRPAS